MGYVSFREGTPQKSNIDIKNGHILSRRSPESKGSIIFDIQPLVFGDVHLSKHKQTGPPHHPGFWVVPIIIISHKDPGSENESLKTKIYQSNAT